MPAHVLSKTVRFSGLRLLLFDSQTFHLCAYKVTYDLKSGKGRHNKGNDGPQGSE
jgi:hypothetical protein